MHQTTTSNIGYIYTYPDQRQTKLAELEKLTQLVALLGNTPNHSLQLRLELEEAAKSLVRELYESEQGSTEEEDDNNNYPKHLSRDHVSDIDINEALQERTYMSYHEVVGILTTSPVKAARKDWDNGLNSEYIEYTQGAGLNKYFQSATPITSKAVRHTYLPSKLDELADDWYILT